MEREPKDFGAARMKKSKPKIVEKPYQRTKFGNFDSKCIRLKENKKLLQRTGGIKSDHLDLKKGDRAMVILITAEGEKIVALDEVMDRPNTQLALVKFQVVYYGSATLSPQQQAGGVNTLTPVNYS